MIKYDEKVLCNQSGWGEDINQALYAPNYNVTPRQPTNLQNRSINPAKNQYAEFSQVMNQTQYAK